MAASAKSVWICLIPLSPDVSSREGRTQVWNKRPSFRSKGMKYSPGREEEKYGPRAFISALFSFVSNQFCFKYKDMWE